MSTRVADQIFYQWEVECAGEGGWTSICFPHLRARGGRCAFLEVDNSPGAGHLIAGGNWNPFSAVSLAPAAVQRFGCRLFNR